MSIPPDPADISIMLISPTNQLLLLHRVKTSSAFASAHVFPGGNCHAFHDGPIPGPQDPDRHLDGDVYKLAAIRETFEESGILLARDANGALLSLPESVREEGRKAVHANKIPFPEWLKSHGGVPDTASLVPFTRWITPPAMKKRFTVQMYIYLLPFDWTLEKAVHDGGLEHTAADFDDVRAWMKKAQEGKIILYSPQAYLISMLGQFFTGPGDYARQRKDLLDFIGKVPTGRTGHFSDKIAWKDKVMSPAVLPVKGAEAKGLRIVAVDKPGPELKDSDRGGDWDRVIVSGAGPGDRDGGGLMWREDALALVDRAQAKL